jgi:hypothetical protein
MSGKGHISVTRDQAKQGPWIVDVVFNDGAETLRGSSSATLDTEELLSLFHTIGEPDGAMLIMNDASVLIGFPSSRVKEIQAREVDEDDQ